jgi:hypothetical protein
MKASFFMFFDYLAMIGVPVLMVLLALNSALLHLGTVQTVLLILIGAGCLMYGAIGIREVYIHGGKKRETTAR